MRLEPKVNGHIVIPAIDQAIPRAPANVRSPPQLPPSRMPLSLVPLSSPTTSVPSAPESITERLAPPAATPLRPAQRGLAWLCELLRSQHEE